MINHQTKQSRSWRWPWVIAVIVGVLVAGTIALLLRFRDTETPVSISEILGQFDSGIGSTSLSTVQSEPGIIDILPSPGVYVYSTVGGEEIDALGGTRHDYPEETALTVQASGCGVLLTWQPLRERFEEWHLCLNEGSLVMPSYTSFHRFFGTDDRQSFSCNPSIVLVPGVGEKHLGSSLCRADGGLVEIFQIALLGPRVVEVGDSEVSTVGLKLDITVEGSSKGTTSAQMWISTTTGVIVRWLETVESVSTSPIGDVTYSEQFDMELTFLEPVQS